MAHCRVCGSAKARFAFHRQGRRYWKCDECHSVTADMTAEQYLALAPSYDLGSWIESADLRSARRTLGVEEKIAVLRRHAPPNCEKIRMLDIGCGAGGYLLAAKELGWEAIGVDPSEPHSRIGRSLGLDIRVAPFNSADCQDAGFDLVMLSHVIEHIYDQRAFVSDVLRVLRPGGVLLMITPNAASLASRISGRFWPMFKPVDHVSMITPSALRFIAPSDANCRWRTTEYESEVLTTFMVAVRDCLRELRRSGSDTAAEPAYGGAPSEAPDLAGRLLRSAKEKAIALLSWPLHLLAKGLRRQACLVVEIEKARM